MRRQSQAGDVFQAATAAWIGEFMDGRVVERWMIAI